MLRAHRRPRPTRYNLQRGPGDARQRRRDGQRDEPHLVSRCHQSVPITTEFQAHETKTSHNINAQQTKPGRSQNAVIIQPPALPQVPRLYTRGNIPRGRPNGSCGVAHVNETGSRGPIWTPSEPLLPPLWTGPGPKPWARSRGPRSIYPSTARVSWSCLWHP